MKLTEFYSKPIKDVIETMEMVDLKVHTDNAEMCIRLKLNFLTTAKKWTRRKESMMNAEELFRRLA